MINYKEAKEILRNAISIIENHILSIQEQKQDIKEIYKNYYDNYKYREYSYSVGKTIQIKEDNCDELCNANIEFLNE